MSGGPSPHNLSEDENAKFLAEHEAAQIAEAEAALAELDKRWPKAVKALEASEEPEHRALRNSGVDSLTQASEYWFQRLGGDHAQEKIAKKGIHHRGLHLHSRAKELLTEHKRQHAKKPSKK